MGDRGRLGLRGIAPQGLEPLGQVGVLPHRPLRDGRVVRTHGFGGLPHADRDRAQAAGVEDPRASQHLRIAGPRVLRQVAQLARAVDAPGRRQHVAGKHLGERGLSGAVAPDEPDLVAVGDAEGDLRHEHAGAHADLEVVHGKHSDRPFRW